MRIAHFVDSIDPEKGGVTSYLMDLLRVMGSTEFQFELNYFDKKNFPVDFQENILLKRRNFNLLNLGGEKNTNASQDQIVHNHGMWLPANLDARCYAQKNSYPLIISMHGMLEPWALDSQKWKKKLAWALYEKGNFDAAKLFHATSEMEADSLRRLGCKQPIAVIPLGVNVSEENAPLVQSTKRTALFLSRIDPKKGLERFFSICERQKKLFSDWELVIAGDGEPYYVEQLKKEAEQRGLKNHIRWLGFVRGEAKENIFKKASLFILPTFSENFGVAIGEALAHGIPVITTQGTPWVDIQKTNCGWYVENTEAAIEEALIHSMKTSEVQLREMGMRGRQLIFEKYQWNEVASKMADTYRWLLKKADRPACIRVD